MADFYERFTLLLNENPNIKQTDVVARTKIDKTSISKYWNKKATPDCKNLFLLADMFGVSSAWLSGADVPREIATSVEINKTTNYGNLPIRQEIVDLISSDKIPESKLSLIKSIIESYIEK